MKERIRQLIAELLTENGHLKLFLRNRTLRNNLTNEEMDRVLDRIMENEELIEKLKEGLK